MLACCFVFTFRVINKWACRISAFALHPHMNIAPHEHCATTVINLTSRYHQTPPTHLTAVPILTQSARPSRLQDTIKEIIPDKAYRAAEVVDLPHPPHSLPSVLARL